MHLSRAVWSRRRLPAGVRKSKTVVKRADALGRPLPAPERTRRRTLYRLRTVVSHLGESTRHRRRRRRAAPRRLVPVRRRSAEAAAASPFGVARRAHAPRGDASAEEARARRARRDDTTDGAAPPPTPSAAASGRRPPGALRHSLRGARRRAWAQPPPVAAPATAVVDGLTAAPASSPAAAPAAPASSPSAAPAPPSSAPAASPADVHVDLEFLAVREANIATRRILEELGILKLASRLPGDHGRQPQPEVGEACAAPPAHKRQPAMVCGFLHVD